MREHVALQHDDGLACAVDGQDWPCETERARRRPSNLGDRTTYIGATDIAAIVGVSPWAAPIDVYREKVEGIESPATAEMEWGLLFEDAICEGYSRQTGHELYRRSEIVHPDYPFLRFHPDRLTRREPGVFDAKATWQRGGGKYGEPGTDQVPAHVRVQLVVYCGATKREWADVGLLRGRPPLVLYRIGADPDLYEALIREAVRFQREHIVPQIPPPPDGTESYRRFLAEQHPKSEEIELIATPEQQLLVAELRAAQDASNAAEARETLVKNRIKDAMGPAAVLIAPGARITYRNIAPKPRWKDIAAKVAGDARVDVEPYRLADIEGRVGERRFIPSFTEEQEEAA